MISDEADPSLDAAEFRSYFPDWTERPVTEGTPVESDFNSYLAGGYAEEFGCHVRHDGDPEGSRPAPVDTWALHPGFPKRPKPVVAGDLVEEAELSGSQPQPAAQSSEPAYRAARSFNVIRVGDRARDEPKPASLVDTLASRWREARIRRKELGTLF